MDRSESRTVRVVLVIAGVASVGVGIVGIVVPVLPTTPFILLAAACFIRSSSRMHGWLLEHRHLGPYVRGFVDGGGVPAHVKRRALMTLWPMAGVSVVIVAIGGSAASTKWAVGVLLLLVVVLVSRYILAQPTRPEDPVSVDAEGDPSGRG